MKLSFAVLLVAAVIGFIQCDVSYVLRESAVNYVSVHTHEVNLSDKQLARLRRADCNSGKGVDVSSEMGAYHVHDVRLCTDSDGSVKYLTCDGEKECWDKHPRLLNKL